MSEDHGDDTEVGDILGEVYQELLLDAESRPQEWITEEAPTVLRAFQGHSRDFCHWLTLAQQENAPDELSSAMAGWLQANAYRNIASRRDLIAALKSLCPVDGAPRPNEATEGSLIAVTGLQLMLLAYVPGSCAFRGLYHYSSLLPKRTAVSVVRSIHVPYGVGTAWEFTLEALKAAQGSVLVAMDAASEPEGRVAGQDYVLGNRWVAGLPLFPTERARRTRGALAAGAFLFVTHPLPDAFAKEGPLQGRIAKVLKGFAPDLALASQEWVMEQMGGVGIHVIPAPSAAGRALPIPASDLSGLVAAVAWHEGQQAPTDVRFGLDEDVFRSHVWSTLSTVALVGPLADQCVVGRIRDEVAKKADVPPGCYGIFHADADSAQDGPKDANDRAFQRLLAMRRAHDLLLQPPLAAVRGPMDIVVPVRTGINDNAVLGVLRINLLLHKVDQSHPKSQSLAGVFSSVSEELSEPLSEVAGRLQAYIDDCISRDEEEALVGQRSHRFRGIKQVDDAWHALGAWLTRVVASTLAGQEQRSPQPLLEFEAMCHMIDGLRPTGVASLQGSVKDELDLLRKSLLEVVPLVWAEVCRLVTVQPVASFVTWWTRSWTPVWEPMGGARLPTITPRDLKTHAYQAFSGCPEDPAWKVHSNWRDGPMQPIAAAAVPGGLMARIADHLTPSGFAGQMFPQGEKPGAAVDQGPGNWARFFPAGSKPDGISLLERALGFTEDSAHWYRRRSGATGDIVIALGTAPGYGLGDDDEALLLQANHESTVKGLRALALDQLLAGVLAGRIQSESGIRDTLETVRRSLAHEMGQFVHYLGPEWADQPEVQKRAFDYYTLWAVPKDSSGDEASRAGALFRSEERSVRRHIEELFGFARSAATLYLATGRLALSHIREVNRNALAEYDRRVVLKIYDNSVDALTFKNALFVPGERSGERPIDYLSRGIIACFTNAIQHMREAYFSTDGPLELVATVHKDSFSATNLFLAKNDAMAQDRVDRAARRIGGTRDGIQFLFSEAGRELGGARCSVRMSHGPTRNGLQPKLEDQGWYSFTTSVEFVGWSPFRNSEDVGS
jgi:hypothetical protein